MIGGGRRRLKAGRHWLVAFPWNRQNVSWVDINHTAVSIHNLPMATRTGHDPVPARNIRGRVTGLNPSPRLIDTCGLTGSSVIPAQAGVNAVAQIKTVAVALRNIVNPPIYLAATYIANAASSTRNNRTCENYTSAL